MQHKSLQIFTWILSLSLLLWCLPIANAEEVLVATNPATPVAKPITRTVLSAIFGMRFRTWENGTPIRVYVLPDNHPVHSLFSKQILRVFPHQLRTAWDRLVFSGTGQAPLEVSTEDEMRASIARSEQALVEVGSEEQMRQKIATTSGAIGYLTKKMVDESVTVLPLE